MKMEDGIVVAYEELSKEELRVKAGAWEKEHSGRSGRIAQQFVTHYLGQVYNK